MQHSFFYHCKLRYIFIIYIYLEFLVWQVQMEQSGSINIITGRTYKPESQNFMDQGLKVKLRF